LKPGIGRFPAESTTWSVRCAGKPAPSSRSASLESLHFKGITPKVKKPTGEIPKVSQSLQFAMAWVNFVMAHNESSPDLFEMIVHSLK